MTEVNETYGCILSKFYIKPQQYMTEVNETYGCILSKFYIKPQPLTLCQCCKFVVSYRNSTSNHNLTDDMPTPYRLYLIEILHQTTTCWKTTPRKSTLYLIEILHQTTTFNPIWLEEHGCILSKFYIKPQLTGSVHSPDEVVSYRNSTSNHNYAPGLREALSVVSYRNSTSNHNFTQRLAPYVGVVSYRNSTSNHNPCLHILHSILLYLIEILHQTTTLVCNCFFVHTLYLIEILHQTTTTLSDEMGEVSLYLIEILHQTTTRRVFF